MAYTGCSVDCKRKENYKQNIIYADCVCQGMDTASDMIDPVSRLGTCNGMVP
jgi:hypothetical protein